MPSLWRALSNWSQRSEGGRGPCGARRLAHGNPDEQRNIRHRRWSSWLGIGVALVSPLLLGQCDPTSGATTGATALALTCTDGQLNGTETDVDCGGNACVPCSTAKACLANGDCTSGVCTGNFCAAATCSDGVANGNEQGLNCGAPGCPACTTCPPRLRLFGRCRSKRERRRHSRPLRTRRPGSLLVGRPICSVHRLCQGPRPRHKRRLGRMRVSRKLLLPMEAPTKTG
jgi:hypothetical protein